MVRLVLDVLVHPVPLLDGVMIQKLRQPRLRPLVDRLGDVPLRHHGTCPAATLCSHPTGRCGCGERGSGKEEAPAEEERGKARSAATNFGQR